MKPFPLSHSEFGDSLRSVFHERFQEQVLRHLLHLHPSAQEVVLKQGDGGKDIVVYDIGRVYACYAPARLNDWEESDVIKKIRADLAKVKANLGDALKEWVFVHNHPQSTLTNKLSDFVLQLRNDNLGIRYFDVWGMEQLWDQLTSPAPKLRREAYLRSVVAGFSRYEELAIDDYCNDVPNPDIWDIFVHPACSPTHLSPEDIDRDEQARLANPTQFKPQHPTQDLLNLLAQPDHRRTVLLADPGMGKSTLVQSIIASLASGREFEGAPALRGLLPVPLILRDLVPLLDQTQPESWTWDSLLTALIERYSRGEKSPPLLDAYRSSPEHRDEFRSLIKAEASVVFLVDGLDEVGDLKKRKQIVNAIQEGIRWASKDARWLITSRVIGYDMCPVHSVSGWTEVDRDSFVMGGKSLNLPWHRAGIDLKAEQKRWRHYLVHTSLWKDNEEMSIEEFEDTWASGERPLTRTLGRRESESRFKSGYSWSIPIAYCFYLAPFDNKRQDDFTERWFEKRHSTDHSASLLREVRQHGHDGVRIISRVPNLLCMMNMLKRSGKPLPDGRHALYEEIVKAYNGGIDAAYFRSNPLSPCCPIEAPERRQLIALIAIHMQHGRADLEQDAHSKGEESGLNGDLLITRGELEFQIVPAVRAMQERGKVQSNRSAMSLLDELLSHVSHRSGLLIPRSVDEKGLITFGFSHLSFLEFFAAEWLAQEFKRHRDRAANRDEGFTEADLDHEFPPCGPILRNGILLQHPKTDFPNLAANPLWHEPLIFLVESSQRHQATLLRWMYPTLNEPKHTWPSETKTLKPLISRDAARLAIKIIQDRDIALPEMKRRQWWNALWTVQLRWHQAWTPQMRSDDILQPVFNDGYLAWDLLVNTTYRAEVLDELATAYEQGGGASPESTPPPLSLIECRFLEDEDLKSLNRLRSMSELVLTCCKGLKSLPDLTGLTRLRSLNLDGCTAMNDFSSLATSGALNELRYLDMSSCSELHALPDMRMLRNLNFLDLAYCTKLEDVSELIVKDALPNLRKIVFQGCQNLSKSTKATIRLWAKEAKVRVQW